MIRTFITTFILSAVTTLPAVAGTVTFDTIALSGDASPGTTPGLSYSSFDAPMFNGAGQVAFQAVLAGTGLNSSNNVGVFSTAAGINGSLGLVARTGDTAPNTTAGINYKSLGNLVLNESGQTAFFASLTGNGVNLFNDQAIFSEAAGLPGSPSLVARESDPIPGIAGVDYRGFVIPFIAPLSLDSAGKAAFRVTLRGASVDSTNDFAIISKSADSAVFVARKGEPVPNLGPAISYDEFIYLELNDAGQTAFLATLVGNGVDSTNNTAIFSEAVGSPGLPGIVAREGNSAPSIAGVNYANFEPPVLNGTGQTAFIASLTGVGVDSSNRVGIFSETVGLPGSPNLVAREGDPAPGTASGVNYGGRRPLSDMTLNDAGDIAFRASLTGPGVDLTNDRAIYSDAVGTPGSLGLVARTGDPAPGTTLGVNYSFLFTPSLNDVGQLAFFADLIGTGVDSTNDTGIWATDTNGVLSLIVREGDSLNVNNDPLINDLRIVSSLSAVSTAFNDRGQLAFSATFTDGSSGVFIANTAGRATFVPEPTTVSMLMIISLGLALVRTSRRGA